MPNDRTLAPLFLGRSARFVEAGRWAQARGFSDELVPSQICWGLDAPATPSRTPLFYAG